MAYEFREKNHKIQIHPNYFLCCARLKNNTTTIKEGIVRDTERKNTARASMHTSVTDHLAMSILQGIWPAGRATTLEEIQKQFNVSRTVARDAVNHLETLGVVKARRRVGIIACDPREWDGLNNEVVMWKLSGPQRLQQIHELEEVRRAIEPVAASAAATRASQEIKLHLLDTTNQMIAGVEQDNLELFHRNDLDFHLSIVESCNNAIFSSLARPAFSVFQYRIATDILPPKLDFSMAELHRDVALAIWNENSRRAYDGMLEIMDRIYATLDMKP